ncbi:hypothetical protein PK69_08785 [Xanthomonas phaseoli pv. phaseoli]|uniref:Uncharacterized protein n=1 Tax=Xanthomonas campestris pv. phaseoli TaxID=317013 RepID=A0AB34QKU3_XANCH|nr:hypothetical protein AC609_08590 [Xanthomonas phaseoli pv. phaseoli]AZU32520.1 hypothetical protein AC801_23040 [Xanthomonas sp. ISO98C4]AZU25528.1 hypothetical protein AC611_08595 [Xanthomonas phaseoli pv. phaseoli]AZU34296.1 hypothetical protein AC610_08585 [Xanthomonas phaseoli pv. phaseoli]KGT51565.1 hypothetical protein NZ02_08905 [Xanthomonas phaseoli pv. phaseoli]
MRQRAAYATAGTAVDLRARGFAVIGLHSSAGSPWQPGRRARALPRSIERHAALQET